MHTLPLLLLQPFQLLYPFLTKSLLKILKIMTIFQVRFPKKFKTLSPILLVFLKKKLLRFSIIVLNQLIFIAIFVICAVIITNYYIIKHISIENNILRLKKIFEIFKNFKKSFYKVWSKNFNNYLIIIIKYCETKCRS